MISSNDLLMGTFVCMLGPLTLDRSAMGSTGGSMGSPTGSSMGQGSMGQGSTGQGSTGQGSMGQGSTGQGSTGQGSMGQGSMGQGGQGYTAGQPGSAAEQCVTVAQAANVMPTALAMGDASAVDSVRRTLDSRLSVEGASPDVSNNTLAFFDKGVAAAKEARTATESIYSGPSSRGVGGGPSSSGSTSAHGHGSSSSNKPDSKQSSSSSRPGADEIRAHRALGDLYQFGRNLGATETGTAAQALAWIIAVDRFEAVNDLPTQQKALAAEPLFAVILNVPAPSGARANAWNEYLAAAARSAGGTTPGGGAVGGGPSGGGEKANMRQVARGAEERLQVLGQQLPPSSPLRSEVDRTIADLRKMETPPATQGTQQQQQPRSTPKKPPSQQQNQPKSNPPSQSPQNQKQQK
jgi:hypothetical protein